MVFMNTVAKISKESQARREFYTLIEYLTLYVNLQEALIDKITINIVDTEYVLINSNKREIARISKEENNLLDVLVTLAPKQIEINKITEFEDKELLKLIIAIFKERVELYMN